MNRGVVGQVVAFVHDTGFADLPAEVVGFARRCVLDLLGVAIAGRTTELSRIVHDHAAGHFGAGEAGEAPLWFDGRIRAQPARHWRSE